MAVLDHLIVRVNDLEASVAFFVDIMGFEYGGREGPFAVIRIADNQQLQLAPWGTEGDEHYAFAVEAGQFQAISDRVQSTGIPYGPSFHEVGTNVGPGSEVGARGEAPTLYFSDPNGHLIEIRCYELL